MTITCINFFLIIVFWPLLDFTFVTTKFIDTVENAECNTDTEDGGSLEQHCSPISSNTFVHTLYFTIDLFYSYRNDDLDLYLCLFFFFG